MQNEKNCCFYISIFHLFTIILPYINEKIKENKNVELLLQKDISIELKSYLDNVKALDINKEIITKLNWDGKGELFVEDKNTIYVVIGTEDFITNYENTINENEVETEVLSCYQLKNSLEIGEVLQNHQYLLATKGKRPILNISQNEQKRKTINSQL